MFNAANFVGICWHHKLNQTCLQLAFFPHSPPMAASRRGSLFSVPWFPSPPPGPFFFPAFLFPFPGPFLAPGTFVGSRASKFGVPHLLFGVLFKQKHKTTVYRVNRDWKVWTGFGKRGQELETRTWEPKKGREVKKGAWDLHKGSREKKRRRKGKRESGNWKRTTPPKHHTLTSFQGVRNNTIAKKTRNEWMMY